MVGDTVEEARDKRALLDSLVHPDSGIAALSIALGHDASGFDLDGPLPDIPETNASKSGRERVIACARRDNLTVRAAGADRSAAMAGSHGRHTAHDRRPDGGMALSDACDGFNIMFPSCRPGSTNSSTGSCRNCSGAAYSAREYEGQTLRENLGLPRPKNRFFE